MAQDVEHILRQYESAPDREPMHGQSGQVRRSPSTDEKRIKRELQRKADLEDPVTQSHTATVADLLAQAGRTESLAERESLLGQVQALRHAREDQLEAENGYQVQGAKIRDTMVPGAVYERHLADSDWLLGISTTADLDEASKEMVVQASLWYGRIPEDVKEYRSEYEEQARNLGRRLAGQYGDQADAAERVFLDETSRLRTQAVKAGMVKEAIEELVKDTLGEMQTGEDVQGLKGASDNAINVAKNASLESYALDTNTALMEEISKVAASSLPQVAETTVPQEQFSNLSGYQGLPVSETNSNRAPALQELAQGEGGQADDNRADAHNGDAGTQQDASINNPQGFPVGASKIASKESHMTQAHAQCPTCGGHGKVAVRTLDPRQAFSGLPQIDQIVNADESPGTTPLPPEVAFPITLNPNNVPSAISQAEQQISERNSKSPLAGGTASQHQAGSGRDNSGWIGDMGAKGPDYDGYSAPTGYDGSSSQGYQNPVYGEGGDNGNQPLLPYGHQEANDVTNNPQQWSQGQPTQNDQGFREVTPGVTTQGQLSQAQRIAQAQAEIQRAQAKLAAAYEGR